MMDEREVLRTVSTVRRETLHLWIERGWLSPLSDHSGFRYRDIDVARLRLIEEFRRDLGLADDALDVILPLLDQVHGLRRRLHLVADALRAEPEDVRRRIGQALDRD